MERFAQAAGRGFAVGTATNGYWAVNVKAARRIVSEAAAAGLKTMGLSTGEMHARYVPPERVILAAVAAAEAGLNVEITIEDFLGTTFDAEAVRGDPRVAELCDDGRLSVATRDWVPNAGGHGRAVLRHDSERSRIDGRGGYCGCNVVLDDLTVTPSLALAACCGYPVDSLPEVHLGSVEHRTLREALEAAVVDDLLYWLHLAGPERMLLFVKDALPDYPLPEAVHPCVACVHLHRDPVALELLRAKAPEYRQALWAAYDAASEELLRLR